MTTACVQVKLELGHKAAPKERVTPSGFTHDWTVFVRGPENANISSFVEKVVFYLHSSFPRPKRVVKEPPYEVSESGYASFNMFIEVYFCNNSKLRFPYDLFLEVDKPVSNIRLEKITVKAPSEEFRVKLLRGGGMGVLNSDDGTLLSSGSKREDSKSPQSIDDHMFHGSGKGKRSPDSSGQKVSHHTPQGHSGKTKDHSMRAKPTSHLKPDPFSELFGLPIHTSKSGSESKASAHSKDKRSSDSSVVKEEVDKTQKVVASKKDQLTKQPSKEKSSLSKPPEIPLKSNKKHSSSKESKSLKDKSIAKKPDVPPPSATERPIEKQPRKEKSKSKVPQVSCRTAQDGQRPEALRPEAIRPEPTSLLNTATPIPKKKINKEHKKPKDKTKTVTKVEVVKEAAEKPKKRKRERSVSSSRVKEEIQKKSTEKPDKIDPSKVAKAHKSKAQVRCSSPIVSETEVKHSNKKKPVPATKAPLQALLDKFTSDMDSDSLKMSSDSDSDSSISVKSTKKIKRAKSPKEVKEIKKKSRRDKSPLPSIKKPEPAPVNIIANNNCSTNDSKTKSKRSDLFNKQEVDGKPADCRPDKVPDKYSPDYIKLLHEIHGKIACLTDRKVIQTVVDIVEETGSYEVGTKTFDFDLCALDIVSVKKLKSCLDINDNHTS